MNSYQELGYCFLKRLPRNIKPIVCNAITKIRNYKIRRLKTPLCLYFFITDRCNASCRYCFYGNHINPSTEELSLNEIKDIASSLKHPLSSLVLTGGEPFLRKDILEICHIFYSYNRTKSISIATNASLPKEIFSIVTEILKRYPIPIYVQVSLDGFEEVHDELKGVKGLFQRAVETVNLLKPLMDKYHNFGLSISTTICDTSYPELERFAKYTQTYFNIPHKFQIIRGSHSSAFSINPEILSDFDPQDGFNLLKSNQSLDSIYSMIKRINTSTSLSRFNLLQELKVGYAIDILKYRKRIVNCLAARYEGVIYPSGEVSFCELTKPIGNIRKTSFHELWNSEEAHNIRQLIKDCFCTHSCNLLSAMRYDPQTLLSLM